MHMRAWLGELEFIALRGQHANFRVARNATEK